MKTLEFSTQIEQGLIRLPKEFDAYQNSFVRIIVIAESPQMSQSKKDDLREIFLKIGKKNIFKKISNPTEWQENLRNEWEMANSSI